MSCRLLWMGLPQRKNTRGEQILNELYPDSIETFKASFRLESHRIIFLYSIEKSVAMYEDAFLCVQVFYKSKALCVIKKSNLTFSNGVRLNIFLFTSTD